MFRYISRLPLRCFGIILGFLGAMHEVMLYCRRIRLIVEVLIDRLIFVLTYRTKSVQRICFAANLFKFDEPCLSIRSFLRGSSAWSCRHGAIFIEFTNHLTYTTTRNLQLSRDFMCMYNTSLRIRSTQVINI